METAFAPAGRATAEQVAEESRQVAAAGFFRELANAVPELLVVLNEQRQIVFANATFCEKVGVGTPSEANGNRLGEMILCMHAHEMPGGCGTSPSCAKSGAVMAMLSANEGRAATHEARIALAAGGSLDLKVAASPLSVSGRRFVVVLATDISGEKRQKVLERVLFRDLGQGIETLHGLFRDEDSASEQETVRGVGLSVSEAILRRLTMHRILMAAESGTLRTRPAALSLRHLIEQTTSGLGKAVSVAMADEIVLNADATIMRQVLLALVTNAMEATGDAGPVLVGADERHGEISVYVGNPGVMPVEVQLQLFHRGFTTKEEGRGVGLYTARLLTLKYLGGELVYDSGCETETRFRLTLPAV